MVKEIELFHMLSTHSGWTSSFNDKWIKVPSVIMVVAARSHRIFRVVDFDSCQNGRSFSYAPPLCCWYIFHRGKSALFEEGGQLIGVINPCGRFWYSFADHLLKF